MRRFFNLFVRDVTGATAIEYAMLAALLAIGIIVSITQLGINTKTPFSVIANTIQG